MSQVFMADTDGFGMAIYNASTSKFCRIDSDSMKPTGIGYYVGNQFYPLEDGITSTAVVQNKDLYYASFAGNKIYKMEISKIAGCSQSETKALTQLAFEIPDQTSALASANCVIFFTDVKKSSVMCADTTKKINSQNMEVVGQDFETLEFSSAMKNRGGKLVILSNKYQLHDAYGGLNISDINFRILSMLNTEIQKKTNCFASCPGNFIYKYI
nr:PREDICTED: uncharacterized protein LOC105675014 isoform X1 [Linepithema humile]